MDSCRGVKVPRGDVRPRADDTDRMSDAATFRSYGLLVRDLLETTDFESSSVEAEASLIFLVFGLAFIELSALDEALTPPSVFVLATDAVFVAGVL